MKGEQKILQLEEALEMLLDRTAVIAETEEIAIWDAAGRGLGETLKAQRDQPPFPRSPLDGYAVRSADIQEACKERPVVLKVIDEVDAGYASGKIVGKGTAVRIMTGAPIPEGADTIVRQGEPAFLKGM